MSLADLPTFYDMEWVKENKKLSTDSFLFMQEMTQTLEQAITLINLLSNARIVNDGSVNRGTVVNDALSAPQKTTAEITALGNSSAIAIGSIFFDTDISKLKVKTAASTIETITSS